MSEFKKLVLDAKKVMVKLQLGDAATATWQSDDYGQAWVDVTEQAKEYFEQQTD